ncbi:hypothetical protein DL1_00770 [Thioclava dalianensis]|uniref:Uncharacterized protein n=1 Tax=Thioclava dalianensis TaxID=1185766 RepID=A0A074TNQ1_9RHOB|nr:hypothetical protein [Thioclava dalianensis]KEP71770.1 hypothetical protein DL1_00770 [Thioclava dalianensis]SFN44104.1 hypothetical protein SAMN05216224_105230 [Thioclava dalianensis]
MIQVVKHETDGFTIEAAIAKFGAGAMLRHALIALVVKGPRPARIDTLSDHVRKDIGLGPAEPPPKPWSMIR